MVATRHGLVLLFLCGCALARHHKPEHISEISSETQTHADNGPVEPERRHRRKRWFSSYGYQQPSQHQQGYQYDAPPPATAPYDPFAYIYRRLDELTAFIRQPIQPPIVVPYPVYLPCSCATGGPSIPAGVPETMPNITTPNRFGEEDDYDDIPIRPLTFKPVKPDRPLSRPPPPVEHGSSQAGAAPPAVNQQGRDPVNNAFGGGFGGSASPAAASAPTTNAPSRCDVAILTCCHQRYTTNQCFRNLGCPEALRRSNPCDASTIAMVVSVFQNFYRDN